MDDCIAISMIGFFGFFSMSGAATLVGFSIGSDSVGMLFKLAGVASKLGYASLAAYVVASVVRMS